MPAHACVTLYLDLISAASRSCRFRVSLTMTFSVRVGLLCLAVLVLSVQAAPARRKQETVVEEVEEETPTTAARGKMATRSIVMGSTSTVAGTLAVVAGYFLGRRADQQEEEAQERRLRYAGRSLTVLGVLAVLFGLASLFRARRCCGRLRRSKKNKKKTR
uniref:Transmembrane protein n=1 Tax=Toxoplasma gondii (strain ATCC 50861 / VEG) TaxID=432359 RepID=A0A0F7V9Y4_TOXGV|nr:TPA: hypothetical protein BN1205_096410 [Toxoplasma gondii VEG]